MSAELRSIVQELADSDPICCDDSYEWCGFCDSDGYNGEDHEHETSCLWVRANGAVGRSFPIFRESTYPASRASVTHHLGTAIAVREAASLRILDSMQTPCKPKG